MPKPPQAQAVRLTQQILSALKALFLAPSGAARLFGSQMALASGSWLSETPDPNGVPVRLVTKIDARAFNEFWVTVVSP